MGSRYFIGYIDTFSIINNLFLAQLIPLAYGINKLRISCVVEDDKISVDWLQEEIESNDQLVQSVDIAAFNKV